jgi:hypothetical protein
MPTPDELGDAAKFHAQDLEAMRAVREARKARGDKPGGTGWRAALAALLRPFRRRSR